MQTPTEEPRVVNAFSVPVGQIRDVRANFVGQPLSFEILLESNQLWQALELCTRIARTDIRLAHLTCQRKGSVYLRLEDDLSADLQDLAFLFSSTPNVSVLRWTTVIGSKG